MKPDPDPWLDSLIQAACKDEVVARALVRHLAVCLERGMVPPPALAAYFATALRGAARRWGSADEKLHLHPKKSPAGFERDYEVADKVWELIHCAGDPLRREDAIAKVADEQNMGEELVGKIYDRMRPLLELEAYEMVVETLEPGEPWPEAPEVPEGLREELRQRLETKRAIISAHLADALKRRGT